MTKQTHNETIRAGLFAVAPILPVFLVLGGLLGLFMNQAGISDWQAWLNSLLVYAGASQFSMVELLNSGATYPIILMVTFVINLRHALMVASMAPWFAPIHPRLALFGVFFVTDESWAVSIREIRQQRGSILFFFAATLPAYVTWSSATYLGWHFGELLPSTPLFIQTINFISMAFFVAILALLYEGKSNILPWLISAVLSIVLYRYVSQSWHMVVAGVAAAIIAIYLPNQSVKQSANQSNTGDTDHE
ncbi:AzlC family ABC transporter permease [Ostreibacterium oceani]|uniref:4-azaleucine resistance transporter AzlC n=1 Tax=Ostreibacterium oceani TaxID=2654998 RepID=A0A6N7EWC9_9GAMM|nr:AzlC family ABC transporter permease [Ostreibacterium oceani]MPV85407.1 hypothetical protein [Ostreibacterium oceani]